MVPRYPHPDPRTQAWIDQAIAEPLLTPGEVAELFGVRSKEVAVWVRAGILDCITLPGGSRRYRRRDVETARERMRR